MARSGLSTEFGVCNFHGCGSWISDAAVLFAQRLLHDDDVPQPGIELATKATSVANSVPVPRGRFDGRSTNERGIRLGQVFPATN